MQSTRLPAPQPEEEIPNPTKTNKKATQNDAQILKAMLKITTLDDKQKRPV